MKKLALTDFAKYRYPSALELSPDGRYLTFALKDVDRETATGGICGCMIWSAERAGRSPEETTSGRLFGRITPIFSIKPRSRTKLCGRGASRKSGRCITA